MAQLGAMEFHLGRVIDHVHLITKDLAASRRFFDAVLGALGRQRTMEGEHFFAYDEFFVSDTEFPGVGKTTTTRLHLAFQAADRDAVGRAYQAGLAAGGRDHGGPGERPYHPGYYAAFLLDPDDNNIEAVYHGPAKRSAASLVITAG
ncbi:MAG TPA: VOC family protein [Burkholderiales bacterium]|nr:VOC family protein [Burkholderiales bacterium]